MENLRDEKASFTQLCFSVLWPISQYADPCGQLLQGPDPGVATATNTIDAVDACICPSSCCCPWFGLATGHVGSLGGLPKSILDGNGCKSGCAGPGRTRDAHLLWIWPLLVQGLVGQLLDG